MASAAKLYSADVLALATSLGELRFDPAMRWSGRARSASCGSTLALSLDTDGAGKIVALGVQAHACAIGQASAAVFARSAAGKARADFARAAAAITAWLAGEGPLPDWPGLAAIEPARAFPGRHGAILLAWKAVLDALPPEAPGPDALPTA
ncbi:MAG: iron-sulfur cluster assembly scaffold protein [Alphaproteobacteria bacterium]|nr:iron-sulfur cluster assembly scaffold protein [Alphaproteobacteria bacterium]